MIDVKGAMTFGEAGKDQARVHNLEDVKAILDIFQAHGHTEVIGRGLEYRRLLLM